MYARLSTSLPSLPIDPLRQLFSESPSRGGNGFGGCDLQGISLGGGRYLANLGSILLDGLAILIALFLIWRSNRKRAAVGRRYNWLFDLPLSTQANQSTREMQLFLLGFIIISICEIFTIGWFPLNGAVRRVSLPDMKPVHVSKLTSLGLLCRTHCLDHCDHMDSPHERCCRLSVFG